MSANIQLPKVHKITAKLRVKTGDCEVTLDGAQLKGCIGIWAERDVDSYPIVILKLRADVDIDAELPAGMIQAMKPEAEADHE